MPGDAAGALKTPPPDRRGSEFATSIQSRPAHRILPTPRRRFATDRGAYCGRVETPHRRQLGLSARKQSGTVRTVDRQACG
jgi:hypothetical protein